MLHFVPGEEDPARIVATLRDALVPGSFLVLQHATFGGRPRQTSDMLQMWNANSPEPMYRRSHAAITDMVDGFALLDPGLVYLLSPAAGLHAKPEAEPERFTFYAAAGGVVGTVGRPAWRRWTSGARAVVGG